MTVGFQIKGQLELSQGLRRMRGQVLDTVGRELTFGLMAVEAKSKPITPVKTGALRAATYVSPAKVENGAVTASIYNNMDYAQYVHERQGFIKWTIPGTGPKFIENPLKEELPNIEDRVSRAVEDLAKGGI
jgi:hypothetical protein